MLNTHTLCEINTSGIDCPSFGIVIDRIWMGHSVGWRYNILTQNGIMVECGANELTKHYDTQLQDKLVKIASTITSNAKINIRKPVQKEVTAEESEDSILNSIEQMTPARRQDTGFLKEELHNHKIQRLYFMAHVDNAINLIRHGLLCRRYAEAENLIAAEHSNQSVQGKRAFKKIAISNKFIHEYAPLYFTTDTPMKYVWIKGTQNEKPKMKREELVFFEFDPAEILTLEGVIISDGNAASKPTMFYYVNPDILEKLDWAIINNRLDWDNTEIDENKRKKQAEVLVPGVIPFDLVKRVVVYCIETWHKVHNEMESDWGDGKTKYKTGMIIVKPSYFR